jgi:hypothetical protein
MRCANGHPDQDNPSENSIIFTPILFCCAKKVHAALFDITTSSFGSAFNGERRGSVVTALVYNAGDHGFESRYGTPFIFVS